MNQEQQLQAIQQRSLRWRGGDTGHVDTSAQTARAMPYAVADVTALLRMVEERDAIIHDLQLDGAALAWRAVGEFAANMMRQVEQQWLRGTSVETTCIALRDWLYRYAPDMDPDPLPPDQARAECERLRAKLRKIREQIGTYLDVYAHYQEQWPGLEPVMKTLIRMASEDTP